MLLGPSGCGKTTTMRAIAGLLEPKSGIIRIEGRDVTRVPANRRNIGLVFQSYALFPHLTAFGNVAFGLRLRRLPKSEILERTHSMLAAVGLSGFSDRKPAELSGGQQQRLALARSMVLEPKVLLLDEPLSNLDARLRLEMRLELQRVQREIGVTMVFVTHDQSEALALADRIVLMKEGRIEQLGTPEEIYNKPNSVFSADFVGFENILECVDGAVVANSARMELAGAPRRPATLAWRPSAVVLGAGPLQGVIKGVSFAGNSRHYVLETAIGVIKAEVPAEAQAFEAEQTVALDLPISAAHRIPAQNRADSADA